MRSHFGKPARPSGLAGLSAANLARVGGGLALAIVGVVVSAPPWGQAPHLPPSTATIGSSTTSVQSTPTLTPVPDPFRTATAPIPATPTSVPELSTAAAHRSLNTEALPPMSMVVPAIDVSGRLQRTRAVDGVVTPPPGVLTWITGHGRVLPGEVGTAVVAGHVVNGRKADVFYHLQEIGPGDKVTVYDSVGKPVVYTVTATRVATKQAVSRDAAVWGQNGSVRRIALITCDDDDGYRADGHRVSNFVAIAEAR